ncbi:hypothetical protein B0A48_06855 [Cryoendolithus antarcticus]|uniref:RING-type domain-containing protein n=1 Tax=Cryoendolithus antarcticus TaxID=1507870 RepID=A0A1V8TA46_9PEZI|nr:hypothetical protein B0A48_06855 [Cryoendolithus antarcticus]
MKFGQEFAQALASEGFPQHWVDSAIGYKNLKKCIKKVQRELLEIGLDASTIQHLSGPISGDDSPEPEKNFENREFVSTAEPGLGRILEEFSPQMHLLVDSVTGEPLDAALTADTKKHLEKLARHEMLIKGRHAELGHATHHVGSIGSIASFESDRRGSEHSIASNQHDSQHAAKWIQVPLASAKDFFDLLEPKLQELEALNTAEEAKLEGDILDLGDMVEDVTEPVRDGFEAKRAVSYRDLYFWREMFRLYMEKPIFYSSTEQNRGALTFTEAKSRLQAYDAQLRDTGLLAKLKTPQAKLAARRFLDVNLDILKIMQFQEMNARAMTKILKKFDKRTHLDNQNYLLDLRKRHPTLLTNGSAKQASGFANSIARDLSAEISSKVLAIVPQLDDWTCPICYAMAWRPVSLGCCKSVFCIRCIIKLQDEGMKRCPCCNKETVMGADGRNLHFETMDFLEKYFPLEVKKRQRENEKAALAREYGEEFVKPGCSVM